MPRSHRPFHMHTLDEIDVTHRIWGVAGVRALLDIPEPRPVHASPPPAPAAARPRRTRQQQAPRVGFVWGWLRRAPRTAVR